jgi:spore maturation protein CgeB
MRFLLVSTDYPAFLSSLYSGNPGLSDASHEKQLQVRADSLFSLADFYSSNLRKLGHEAWDLDVNNEFIQKAWAREHGVRIDDDGRWEFRLRRGIVPWFSRLKDPWFYDILAAQIKHYKPDVLLNHAIDLSSEFFREMKPYVRFLIGSHASPLTEAPDLRMYDLMLSVVDNFVDYFKQLGVRSERLRFAFEPRLLDRFGEPERSIPASFVGNLFSCHADRIRWLEHLCERIPVQVWTGYTSGLPEGSPVRGCVRGAAWGADMYDVLFKSRITLNSHVDVAGGYAGNLRLFEATGSGALLITDWKKNLHEMFEAGKEILAYRTADECRDLVEYYLSHDAERQAIAQAGQRRTLREHTYYRRMQELVAIIGKYI